MMSTNGRWWGSQTWSLSIGAAIALAAGCGRSTSSAPEELGVARIAITQAPSDTRCVRVTVAGSRTVTSSIDVTPGESTVFMLTGLALGDDAFSGEAFSVACAQVTPMNVAVWVGDPVVATVVNNPPVDVTLILHRNGRANVGVDFQDDGTGGAMGVGGATGVGGAMGVGGAGVGGSTGGPITFGPPLTLPLPEPVAQMISADINGDGVGDVVWASPTGGIFGAVSNGPMLSSVRLLARVITAPAGLVAVDLNADGMLDLVLGFAGSQAGGLALLQVPGGGFGQAPLPGLPPVTALAAGDVDGDGVVDLVASTVTGSLLVAPARLPLTFQSTIPGIPDVTEIVLVQTPPGAAHNVVVLSNSRNLLTSFIEAPGGVLVRGPITPLPAPASAIDSADFNGDGFGDITAATPAGVVLLTGDGRGGFLPRTLAPPPVVGVVALDLNRDGLPDIAAVTPQSVIVFGNPGGGMFTTATSVFAGPPPATALVAGVPAPGNRFPLIVAGANGTVLSALLNTSP